MPDTMTAFEPLRAAPAILEALALDNELNADYLVRTYDRPLADALEEMVRGGFVFDEDAVEVLGAGGGEQFGEDYGKVEGFKAVDRLLEKAFADPRAAL